MQADLLEAQFLAACADVRAEMRERRLEICPVLDRLTNALVTMPDAQVVDIVDELMDDLFRLAA